MIAALCAALALTACGKAGERVRFDGNYYPAKLSQSGERREDFVVTVSDAAQGINGAREAGRFEGTTYCVETYGDSSINWQPGYGPEDGRALTGNGSLLLRGSCVIW
ncbi:hypothetical protein DC366_02740 [Pelagivirga sediminicola]|uniref:Uncharacterized protein n=2 Tax=Pelagivirga sediminicola TaxID=2170575 RepID=A0A2T7GBR2_9RHOB|nr:hypothetical protein DC366_02740 [Pelagivirga sediminicola]